MRNKEVEGGFYAKMPRNCSECPIIGPCHANNIGTITCYGQLWKYYLSIK